MPTVRTLGGQRVSTAALPGERLTGAATAESLGAGAARQRAGAWGAVADTAHGLGRQFVAMDAEHVTRARNHANEVALLEAKNKLDQWELDRLYAPDSGALNVHGKGSFELPEKIDEEFGKFAGGIEAGLANDEQRLAFAKLRQQRGSDVSL